MQGTTAYLSTAADLIRLGFHGFALVMLFMGFQLMRTLITERNQDDGPDEKKGPEDGAPEDREGAPESTDEGVDGQLLNRKLQAVRFFILASFLFFVAGASLELIRGSQLNELNIIVTPSEMPDQAPMPTIIRGIEKIHLEEGRAAVKVRNQDQINVQVESLKDELVRRKYLLNQITARCGEDEEMGFDDV